MQVNKDQWPEGTTVDLEGFYSPDGEVLNSEPHTQAFVDEWNGVKPKAPAKKKAKAVPKAPAEDQMSAQVTAVTPAKKKKWFKKK